VIRWGDELRQVAGLKWMNVANNRRKWSELSLAYAQKWAAEI